MAEAMLTKRFPLAGIMVPGRHGKPGGKAGVTIRVIDEIAIAQVSARKGQNVALLQVLARMFGAPVADQPQRVARDTLSITGISPGQWRLVVRGHDSEATLRTAIAELQESAVVTELGRSFSCGHLRSTGAGDACQRHRHRSASWRLQGWRGCPDKCLSYRAAPGAD